MNTTIRGHNLRVTVVMALLAVLLLLAVALVFALRPAPTTSDRDAKPRQPRDERRQHRRIDQHP